MDTDGVWQVFWSVESHQRPLWSLWLYLYPPPQCWHVMFIRFLGRLRLMLIEYFITLCNLALFVLHGIRILPS